MVIDELLNTLLYCACDTGEAAGVAMGLVMVGTRSSSAISDLLTVSIQSRCDQNHQMLTIFIVQMLQYHFWLHFTATENVLFIVSFSMLEKLNMKRYNVD